MKRILVVLSLGIIFMTFFSTGCTRNSTPTPEPNTQQPGQQGEKQLSSSLNLRSFFPLTEGSTWKYQGEGNEYASFSREVLFIEGDKAQIRENNGGTVSAAVFKVTDKAITRIFFQGEEYEDTNIINQEPNENLVILKTPVEVGSKWNESNGNREIVSVDAAVNTPAGEFDNCIKVKITTENSTIFEYYKSAVGMVKREFISGDYQVISSLERFNISP